MDFKGILVFILAISVLVSIHELGHLLVAKLFGVYCHEYAVGFGPKLFSKKGKETTYSLRAIPLGGYVSMAGEAEAQDDMPKDLPFERTIKGIHPFKRILIMLAGITMNILLFMVAFGIIVSIQGVADSDNTTNVVGGVMKDYPAEKAGVKPNDRIIGIVINNEKTMVTNHQEINETLNNTSSKYTYIIDRDGKEIEVEIEPVHDATTNRYLAGVQFISETKKLSLIETIGFIFKFTGEYFVAVLMAILNLFRGQGLENVGGPIAIMSMSNEVANQGLISILGFIGQLSMSLAVFNLLPIPALDGGRVLLTLPELITGKPLNKKAEETLIMVSFALLLTLIVFIMFLDVKRFF